MRHSAQLRPGFPDDVAGIFRVASCGMTRRRFVAITLMLTAAAACGKFSSATMPAPQIVYLASPFSIVRSPASVDTAAARAGALIVLDSASLRPVLARAGTGVVTFTNFQGSRYHPEAVRAIAEEPSVTDTFSRSVAAMASAAGAGLLLDFQEMSPSDLPRLVELVRGIGTAHRSQSRTQFGMIVPAGDTLAYPALLLARVADLVVIRVGIEHRPGTPPGPLATPEFIRRELGSRVTGLGATRLGVELPLYGYMWNRNGSARIITYREANSLVLQEAMSFRRDAASQFLTASGRDGWTIWIPDAQTVRTMIDVAQSRGVNVIALTGLAEADPLLTRGTLLRR